LVAVAVEVLVTAGLVYSVEDGFYLAARLLPNALMTEVAAIAVALMVRGVQEEVTREQVEATRLALAEAKLNLTQTKLVLAQAELRALHAQITPHFFFNSLNTIRYFIRTDPEIARDLLSKLFEIFQRVLTGGDFVPL
jgi:sensor histidine kinase YesM